MWRQIAWARTGLRSAWKEWVVQYTYLPAWPSQCFLPQLRSTYAWVNTKTASGAKGSTHPWRPEGDKDETSRIPRTTKAVSLSKLGDSEQWQRWQSPLLWSGRKGEKTCPVLHRTRKHNLLCCTNKIYLRVHIWDISIALKMPAKLQQMSVDELQQMTIVTLQQTTIVRLPHINIVSVSQVMLFPRLFF